MIVDKILIVPELHYGDLVFLAFLSEFVDFSSTIVEELSALPDLVF